MGRTYDKNDGMRFTVQFTDALSGSVVDPTTVRLFIKNPGNLEETYIYPASILQSSPGNYYKDIIATISGIYYYRWQSDGSFPSAFESFIIVKESQFP